MDFWEPYGDKNLDGTTLPLDRVIINAIEARLLMLHTWLPAKVVKLWPNGLVDLELQLQSLPRGATKPKTLPVVQKVLVEHPRGATWSIKLPVAVGDLGRAIFCERSLDIWRVQGGVVDPKDGRHHDLSDAVFVPGLYPNNAPLAGAPEDMILTNGSAQILLHQAGTFEIRNPSHELLTVLDELAGELKSLVDDTSSLNTEVKAILTVLATPANIDVISIGPGGAQFGSATLASLATITAALTVLGTTLSTLASAVNTTRTDLGTLKT